MIQNNNPGNVRDGVTPWRGQIGVDAHGFCIFDTPESGIRCIAKILMKYQAVNHLLTVRGMINRWAPPSENNTAAYISDVCSRIGVGEDDDYTLTQSRLIPLVAAIIQHENGQQPYTTQQLTNGVNLAYQK